MAVIALSVVAALGWGASDYFGGAVRRRTPVLLIVCLAELAGLVALAPVLVARGALPPADPRLWLAALAGATVTLELALVYAALARGEAFITAPVGALGAAVAVLVGLVGGDHLDLAIALGLALALAGATVTAWTSPDRGDRAHLLRTAWVCAAAAAAVGTTLSTLHAAGRLDPYWATGVEHASTAITAGAVVLVRRWGTLRASLDLRRQSGGIALIAMSGVTGDLAYAIASQRGALSVVSAIGSLYPLMTVGLGVFAQGRRATVLQGLGIAVALTGAVVLGAATG